MAERRRSTRFSLTPKKKVVVSMDQITEEDKLLAREVWMQVESNYVVISKALFSELFARYPDYKNFFKDLISVDDSDNWLNPRFERHMVQVLMPSLGDIIKHLDDPAAVTAKMEKLGRLHRDKEMGLKKEHVENLKGIFVEVLTEFFGAELSPAKGAAVVKVFTAAFNVFETQLKNK